MKYKINDKIVGFIKKTDEKGRGVVELEGKHALAYFTIPGEKISGTVSARIGGELRVRTDAVLEPSPDRVTPRCPSAGACGGCPWQMISYDRQSAMKLGIANEAMQAENIPLAIKNFTPAASQYYHRNRMDYVFGPGGELGLKKPEQWNTVLNLNSCFMLSPAAVKIMDIVREIAKASHAPFWDNRLHTGFWRYLVIREGKNTGERLVLITTSAELEELPFKDELIETLKPLCTSLLWGVNPTITDLSIPKTIKALFGNEYLNEKINGLDYRIPCASFFQTNSEMSAALQKIVVEFAAPAAADKVMDLYCGSGFLTLALARAANQVIGVELDDAAVAIARANAELNKINNVDFRAGAAENLLGAALADMKPDTIVLDPPRSGLHPKALEAITDSGAKRLVYVSCNPNTLARDLKLILTKYSVEQARCLDLFPHTPHIETVVSLKLR